MPSMKQCGNCGQSFTEGSPPSSERSDTIENLLSKSALREENVLKERLKKRKGILVRALVLPMTIVFRSEIEFASLLVDKEGNISVRKGMSPKPQIVIEGSHASLCQILQSREPKFSTHGSIKLTLNWGPFRNKIFEFVEGQVMDHPLKDLYGY